MQELLTVDEAAEYLRKSRLTIYHLIKKGIIPAEKIGRSWLINVDALHKKFKFLESQDDEIVK